jgi:hypothetical protein
MRGMGGMGRSRVKGRSGNCRIDDSTINGCLDAAAVTTLTAAYMAGNKVLCSHCNLLLSQSTVNRHQARQRQLELEASAGSDLHSDDEHGQENSNHGHDYAPYMDVDHPIDPSLYPNNQLPLGLPPERHNNSVALAEDIEDELPDNELDINDGWFEPYSDEDKDNVPHAINDRALGVEWDFGDNDDAGNNDINEDGDSDDDMSDLGHLIDCMDQEELAREMYELGRNVCIYRFLKMINLSCRCGIYRR